MRGPLAVPDTRLGPFQIAILILTVMTLFGIVADTLVTLPAEASRIVGVVDTLICGVFLIDFCNSLYRAPSKMAFLKWGWIDLLASIPNVEFLRWGRLVRVLRIIRLLRGIRSVHKVFSTVMQNRLEGGAVSVALISFLLVTFSSVAILVAEQSPQANIRTAEDALWWSMTTVTTVGYGDRYPVTTEGHIVGMLLMICGVGLFGVLSGSVASLILGSRTPPAPEAPDLQTVLAKLDSLEKKLDAVARTSHRVGLRQPPEAG